VGLIVEVSEKHVRRFDPMEQRDSTHRTDTSNASTEGSRSVAKLNRSFDRLTIVLSKESLNSQKLSINPRKRSLNSPRCEIVIPTRGLSRPSAQNFHVRRLHLLDFGKKRRVVIAASGRRCGRDSLRAVVCNCEERERTPRKRYFSAVRVATHESRKSTNFYLDH